MITGSYKSAKPIDVTGIDKSHLESDCYNGFIVNGTRKPFLYSVAPISSPSHKMFKEPRINFFK